MHLTVADGPDVVFVERLQTLAGIRLMEGSGRRMPAHATSAGKVLAAFDPAVEKARLAAGFPRLTPQTIGTAAEFACAVADARRTGIAVSVGESRPMLTSVAAPLRDVTGRAYAAVSVVGPTPDFGDLGRATRLVLAAAAKLTHLRAAA